MNVMEAMISAALSRTPDQLGPDDYLDVIQSLGIEPRILYPDGYRRVNRFAFVIHPLSQQYLTKTPPLDWVANVSPPVVMNLVEKAIAYSPPFIYSKVSGIRSPNGDEVEGWLITVGGTPGKSWPTGRNLPTPGCCRPQSWPRNSGPRSWAWGRSPR